MFRLLLIAALLLSSPVTLAGNLRVLLIGIDYHGADPLITPLHGAVRDVDHMRELMTGPLGIPASAIRTLTERQATRVGILNAIRDWLIDGTAPGDQVFLMFSGHGIQVPDPWGDQAKDPAKRRDPARHETADLFDRRRPGIELAEALVPYDMRIDAERRQVSKLILDSELNQLLTALEGRRVTLWLDNCHSGGATRSALSNVATSRFVPRSLKLPWPAEQTRVTGAGAGRSRGLRRDGDPAEAWRPPYRYFAAARYFQLAHEDGGQGLFTGALLELLRADPTARYSNGEVIAAARDFLQYRRQMPPETQQPIFYGPAGSEDETFLLLAQDAAPAPAPADTPDTAGAVVTRIDLRGSGPLAERLRQTLREHPQFALDAARADLVLTLGRGDATLYHPAGQTLQQLDAGHDAVLDALLTWRTAAQLGTIHNPAAPFQVELWLDRPGRTRFHRDERPLLYYRVQGLPYPRAYLTLLNLAPDGTLAVLYPSRDAGEPGRRRYLNAPVEAGRVHSIPRGTGLAAGENVAWDRRLRLSQVGEERFKAIVTPRPLALTQVDARLRDRGLAPSGGAAFTARLEQALHALAAEVGPQGWGVGDLRVSVEER